MKVYVWGWVETVTSSYHSEGGVVVFAATEQRARELANAVDGCQIEDDEPPDDVRDVAGGEEKVYIMPNAGCC